MLLGDPNSQKSTLPTVQVTKQLYSLSSDNNEENKNDLDEFEVD